MKNFKMLLCAAAAVLSMQQTVMGSTNSRPNPSSMEVHVGSIRMHLQRLSTELDNVFPNLRGTIQPLMASAINHANLMPNAQGAITGLTDSQLSDLVEHGSPIVTELEEVLSNIPTNNQDRQRQEALDHLHGIVHELRLMVEEIGREVNNRNSCVIA